MFREKVMAIKLIGNLKNGTTPYHNGLSKEGVEMVREMNRIGM